MKDIPKFTEEDFTEDDIALFQETNQALTKTVLGKSIDELQADYDAIMQNQEVVRFIDKMKKGMNNFDLMEEVSKLDDGTKKLILEQYIHNLPDEQLALIEETSQYLESYYKAFETQNVSEQKRLEKLYKANYKKLQLSQLDQKELSDLSPEELLDLEMQIEYEAEDILFAYKNKVSDDFDDEYYDEDVLESLYDLLGDLIQDI